MSAIERVEQLLRRIHEGADTLRAAETEGLARVAQDPLRWAGVERLAQITIQACVDLSDWVLAAEGIEEPPRARDVFSALASAGLLDPDLARTLEDLVGLRNTLAHEYLTVTVGDLSARIPEIVQAAEAFADAMVLVLPSA